MTRAAVRSLVTFGLAIALAGTALGSPEASGPSVPRGYEAASTAILREGQAVVEKIRAGDAESVFALFSSELAQTVPKSTVEQVLRETVASAPLGARIGESALPAGPDRRIYLADHRWGARRLGISLVLDDTGAIAGIEVRPRKPLPRDPNARRELRARLSLPFRGEWWVFWGGHVERLNYHVVAPDQRHAFDFVAWRSGATHRGSGKVNTDYWAWGRPIVAPADGVVVSAVDGVRDNKPQVEVENHRHPAGNHVVLDLGNGEYALLAHLRRGSVRVKPGERVRAGVLLGLCGNSGNSTEPHLHFHVQDRAKLSGRARGLPITFRSFKLYGHRVVRAAPVQGQFIRP
jgi:murein DD-endopeptidase MepM/ murein hydrolase activator NlpD